MKPKRNKKLSVKKSTVSNLSQVELNHARGGATFTCTLPDMQCITVCYCTGSTCKCPNKEDPSIADCG